MLSLFRQLHHFGLAQFLEIMSIFPFFRLCLILMPKSHPHSSQPISLYFMWRTILADVLYVILCLLDYGPEALRLEEETVCYLQRRRGSGLWWLSQVIIATTEISTNLLFAKYKLQLIMCNCLSSYFFFYRFIIISFPFLLLF